MLGIGVEPKVSVQEIGVGVVVELMPAQPALQAQSADALPRCAQIQRCHVARHLGIQLPTSVLPRVTVA